MKIFFIIIITLLLINLFKERIIYKINNIDNIKQNNNNIYKTNFFLMTPTELKFYKELKKVTDKNNLTIFSQVNLERIIQVKDNNFADRNRIKSRSIDYTIVNNENCKIICCIELDDYTHNRENVKKNDNFKNEIFESVGIPLHRIKVQNNYNLEELEKTIIGDI